MRSIFRTLCLSVALSGAAWAQTTPAPIAKPVAPTVAAPVAPTMPDAAAASTPAANSGMEDMLKQQVAKITGSKGGNQAMGQMMVMGQLMSCTQKQAGQAPTQAFYKEMQQTGKTVEGYCKTDRAADARQLVLTTLTAKKNDPVMKALLNCYDAQSANVNAMGGAQVAAQAAQYARWAHDPAAAQSEMKPTDICKPNAATAAPVTPIAAPASVPAPSGVTP